MVEYYIIVLTLMLKSPVIKTIIILLLYLKRRISFQLLFC